ncbi:MAG: transporter [Thermodesulfobacteriota bacterium]|nr:transporter [Thermodesulfobacteriota bacterium]
MKRSLLFFVSTIALVQILYLSNGFAAHPLITDDTGTQGKKKFQLEVNSELTYDREKEEGVRIKETGGEVATILSYGILDNIDIVLGAPFQWFRVKEEHEETNKYRASGISDLSLELKWRFFEKDGLSAALKPGITLPTGNEKKRLGNGRPSYGLTLITTKELGRWAFHLNLGYMRNEYKLREDKETNRKDLWHVSFASEVEVVKNLKLLGNIGMERNSEKASSKPPAFILGGLIYSVSENINIDLGVKGGLNKQETDFTILTGIALRF